MKNEVVLLFGYICSGKTTLAQTKYRKHRYIKVSDIVKKLSGGQTRKELQGTADLDLAIAHELFDLILNHKNENLVIDGIRQPSIVEYLLKHFWKKGGLELVWLDTPIEVCRERFYTRARAIDSTESYEDAVLRDDELGLNYIPLLYKDKLSYEQPSIKTN